MRAGRWTFWLAIDSSSRFPDAQAVVPKPSAVTCRLFLDEADVAFLVNALPKLPGQDDDHSPITLDLGREVLVRARAQNGDAVTEVELSRSRVEGNPTRHCLDRTNLRRALQMGFTEVFICQAESPVLVRDRRRVFVFMPLDKQSALAPSPDAVRITSPSIAPSATEKGPEQTREGRIKTMPAPHPNNEPPSATRGNGASAEGCPSIMELIAEADALRACLQESSDRLARLLAGLKQHKRVSRAMRAAVQSLRQLKLDG
jgi:hypothetical protein